ncbi:MAG TPA: substrate-binding domain-containing protein [Micropepsaceae bacterium]|nr:substrate-binding domain-containing protein [Micropepsaceae bacterium]
MATTTADAAEIKVIASPGVREAYNELVPQFEKASGNHVTTIWDGVNNVAKRVAGGEVADIVMLPVAQIDGLTKQGKLVMGSRVDVAKSGIGVAIKAGAPKPDLSSGEALKNALLKAKSIAYSTGPSGVHMARLLQQWGIADAVKAKIVIAPTDTPVGEVVARGGAEIGFQQVSELVHIKGIDYLGPLPGDVQETTVFAAALHKSAGASDAAKALMKFLSAPAAAVAFKKAGMEPG